MAYEKQEWKDGEEGGTPISAERLNHIEEGIESSAEKSELSDYAKTSDLESKADKSELSDYAKTSDLADYAKTEDLAAKADESDLAALAARVEALEE